MNSDQLIAYLRKENDDQKKLIADLTRQVADLTSQVAALAAGMAKKDNDNNRTVKGTRTRTTDRTSQKMSVPAAHTAKSGAPTAPKKTTEVQDRKRKASNEEIEDSKKSPRTRLDSMTGMEIESDEEDTSPTTQGPRTYATAAKKDRIPPINIKGRNEWSAMAKKLDEMGATFKKAHMTKDGIKIFPETAEDYRKIRELLNQAEREYFTFQLPEERKMHVVIRGLDEDMDPRDIQAELQDKGIQDAEVSRMTSRRTKMLLPLFLVKTNMKEIYDITRLNRLVVRIETKIRDKIPGQCYRCQRYGHAQSRCTYKERCVKCGEDHASRSCPLPAWDKVGERNSKCALCGEKGHPASYRGCSRCPSKTAIKTSNTRTATNKNPANRSTSDRTARTSPRTQDRPTALHRSTRTQRTTFRSRSRTAPRTQERTTSRSRSRSPVIERLTTRYHPVTHPSRKVEMKVMEAIKTRVQTSLESWIVEAMNAQQ